MSCYIVTFEVADPAAKTRLKEQIKTYNNYCPINENSWAVVTENTALQVCNYLKTVVADTDRIFVIKSGTEGAWINAYGQPHTDWLRKNL